MHSFHETKTSPALPPSNLPEAVQLLENEISQQLKRAEGSSLDVSHRPQRALGFQAKMQQLLVQPPPLDPTKAVCVRPSIPRQSDSPFWASFLQTSHPLIPSSIGHQDIFDNSTAMENSCDRPIPYATTPFTQKLFQACAESGHRYLTNDTVTDHEMWNEFGLMLQKVPRAQIVAYFKRVLAAKPCNPVEDLQFPFISLGGAGTHFPRAKQMSIGGSGLQNLLPFQTTNGIKEILSDEEWFDVHDVEGLLSSQNILLNTDRSHPMKSTLLDKHEISPLAMSNMESSQPNCEVVTDGQLGFFEQDISQNPAMSIDEDVIISGKFECF